MTQKLNIAVLGAGGRMGQAIIRVLSPMKNVALVAALTHEASPTLGQDAVALAGAAGQPVILSADLYFAKQADVIIDFSAPLATLALIEAIKDSDVKAVVSGTTGFDAPQSDRLDKAVQGLTFLQSGNFSLGVNMLEALVEMAAAKLKSGWDIEILEMHHKAKVDAPSGTGLMLGQAAAKGRGVTLGDTQVLSREGQTGARRDGDIGFAVLRGGGVVGDHSVIIASELEKITLSHSALDRSVFAQGAVSAAIWAAQQTEGRYDMKDVLGL
jgi:4-hydroxy-tetrahydrodipicolinate reductase